MNFTQKPVVPIYCLADRSVSNRSEALCDNIYLLLNDIKNYLPDGAVGKFTLVTFNHRCDEDDVIFHWISSDEPIPDISFACEGATDPAAGIDRVLNMMAVDGALTETDKRPSHKPVLIMITDGYPDCGNSFLPGGMKQQHELMRRLYDAADRIKTLEKAGRLSFFIIAFSPDREANLPILKVFSDKGEDAVISNHGGMFIVDPRVLFRSDENSADADDGDAPAAPDKNDFE